MQSKKKWVFSFRYTRRGTTYCWDGDAGDFREHRSEESWQGPRVWVAEQTDKVEWIYVAIEKIIDTEDEVEAWRDEALDEAERSADAEFLKRHPDVTLV
jgi:hypothetical protein